MDPYSKIAMSSHLVEHKPGVPEKEISIKQFMADFIDPSFKVNEELPFKTTFKTIKKNTIITCYNQVEHYAYFLIDGIARITMVKDGEEKILEFFFPNSFFSSYTSFLTKQPSDVEVQAMTDCEVEVIRDEDIQKAYENSLLANKLGRKAAEYYYIMKTKREKDFLVKSATERYSELLARRSELVQQIPVNMIAKYLGIKPESLSRIRKGPL